MNIVPLQKYCCQLMTTNNQENPISTLTIKQKEVNMNIIITETNNTLIDNKVSFPKHPARHI
jgi:hypothetical protein